MRFNWIMKPSGMVGTALVVCAILMLAGCGSEPEPAEQRVVILGFDGMDPVLAQRWMDEGKLPNFSRLAESGHFQPLGTSMPALTAFSISCVVTPKPMARSFPFRRTFRQRAISNCSA